MRTGCGMQATESGAVPHWHIADVHPTTAGRIINIDTTDRAEDANPIDILCTASRGAVFLLPRLFSMALFSRTFHACAEIQKSLSSSRNFRPAVCVLFSHTGRQPAAYIAPTRQKGSKKFSAVRGSGRKR